MNSRNILMMGLLASTVTSTAFAGPDWEIIQIARSHRTSNEQAFVNRNILPINRGSSAMTTPYANQARQSAGLQKAGTENQKVR